MSTFCCYQKEVKIKKPHVCETCGRMIPKGAKAYHTGGMFEGDWQNWYMCGSCYDNNVAGDEYVCCDDFMEWVFEQPFSSCPECDDVAVERDWNDKNDTLLFECDCGHKWKKYIGWNGVIEC